MHILYLLLILVPEIFVGVNSVTLNSKYAVSENGYQETSSQVNNDDSFVVDIKSTINYEQNSNLELQKSSRKNLDEYSDFSTVSINGQVKTEEKKIILHSFVSKVSDIDSPGSPEICNSNDQCSFVGGECRSRICQCQTEYVPFSKKCYKKTGIYSTCQVSEQCVLTECEENACSCYSGICHTESTKPNKMDAGMTQIVTVIIGCVAVTSIICIITVLYRRYNSYDHQPRVSRTQRSTNSTSRMIVLTSAEENRLATIDTPPRYEEVVVIDLQKDPEPPSYTESLKRQRTSFQSLTVLPLPINTRLIRNEEEEYDNPAFVRL